jgi:hypothetical protein
MMTKADKIQLLEAGAVGLLFISGLLATAGLTLSCVVGGTPDGKAFPRISYDLAYDLGLLDPPGEGDGSGDGRPDYHLAHNELAAELSGACLTAGLIPAVPCFILGAFLWQRSRRLSRQLRGHNTATRILTSPSARSVVDAPPCLAYFGLTANCTPDDVRKAYRCRAMELHPDRGGSEAEFVELQRNYEDALRIVPIAAGDRITGPTE